MSSSEVSNNGVIFTKGFDSGLPVINEHFKIAERKINISSTKLEKGEILVKNLYISLDLYVLSRMKSGAVKSYLGLFPIGCVLESGCISVVVKSNNDQWKESDLYSGVSGWEEYTKISPEAAKQALPVKQYLKNSLDNGIPLSYSLGILGMPGMTAYVGLNMIGKPKKGETIFISTAAGGVGQVVGQIAKLKGLKVVGSTGDDNKVNYLINELKYDHAINYKKVDIGQTLKDLCPEGIDIFFDNVGGETLDKVLPILNEDARVISCGMTSQLNTESAYGVKNLTVIIPKSILIQGFIVFRHYDEYHDSFQKEMLQWLKEGKLKYKENIVNGIENAPQAYLDLYNSKGFGKYSVKVSDL
ncbi:NAD(P)-binding protein [Rhizophagus irregularis]|uniref:NAD(P)-binding protein n=1 Tax=Rhizophagus irregularis TaxID=588596 RepID=A0A2N0R9J0_9GLOM|nr:NAD(P)-binding protein [Rhizophagus irregularis]